MKTGGWAIAAGLLGLVPALPLAAQEAVLAGTVTDSSGGPIPGARVEIVGTGRQARTDDGGRYRLAGLAPGQQEIQVTAASYQTVIRRVTLHAGQATTASFVLVLSAREIAPLVVLATPGSPPVRPAEDLTGMVVMAGSKSEVLDLSDASANLAEKTGRQVFARLPGIFVYDMDGGGNQINIATRGLDPHRSWEMNVRQDGVLVNSDMYGYPASHYSPPLEAVQEIRYVRGTASLQYGSQFGGYLDYLSRGADTTAALGGRLRLSGGAFGLGSAYGEAGGRAGPVSYFGYANLRRSDGFRPGSTSEYDGELLSMTWTPGPRVALRAQVGRTSYLYRIPGPLTDSMFQVDPRAVTRHRNWFSPTITVPSLRLDWQVGRATRLAVQGSAVLGDRSSVQFVGFATTPDSIRPATGDYAPRQVDIDQFRSLTTELRLTHDFRLGGRTSTLVAGLAYTDNDLWRRQQGQGTTGSDYDLSVTAAGFRRDVHYLTRNVAVHAEGLLRATERWTVLPGLRVEHGDTRLEGQLAYYDPANLPNRVDHEFPLFGVRTEYRVADRLEAYGGWSQAFRPMVLKDVLPDNALERTDTALVDASGWTLEAGLRGRVSRATFDLTVFALRYDNRFGSVLETAADGTALLFKTNVGSSLTRGVEIALDVPLVNGPWGGASLYTATAFYDAGYREGSVVSGGQNRSIAGNRVESVPRVITRWGLTGAMDRWSGSLSLSHTGRTYSDPLNSEEPSANGATGPVPAYTVVDLSAGFELAPWATIRAGVSNLLDHQYFTKRPTSYPGPGVWPSDGRGGYLSVECH